MDTNDINALDDYVTKDYFLEAYPNLFTKKEFDSLMAHKHENGFINVIRKVTHKKTLIHIPSVIKWIEGKNDVV